MGSIGSGPSQTSPFEHLLARSFTVVWFAIVYLPASQAGSEGMGSFVRSWLLADSTQFKASSSGSEGLTGYFFVRT